MLTYEEKLKIKKEYFIAFSFFFLLYLALLFINSIVTLDMTFDPLKWKLAGRYLFAYSIVVPTGVALCQIIPIFLSRIK